MRYVPFAEVNSAQIFYEEWGSGPAVLCIHGTGTYGVVYEWSMKPLADARRVIAYDRRGYARSGGEPAHRIADHVSDAVELLRALDGGPAAVVAQSGAGPIALALAAEHPELVSALVLAEPAYQVGLVPSLSAARGIGALQYRYSVRRRHREALLGYFRWASRYESGGNGFDPLPEEWRETALRDNGPAIMRELLQLGIPWPSPSAVRGISCPVTLVVADNGEPVFRKTTHRVARLLPGAALTEAPGAGHLIPTDKPEEFEAIARTALDDSQREPAVTAR